MKKSKSDSIGSFSIGKYVRYKNTGTIGKIIDITISKDNNNDNSNIWILIDTNNLYYNSSTLEIIDIKNNNENNEKTNNIEKNIQEKIRIQNEAISEYRSENIDAPGGAG